MNLSYKKYLYVNGSSVSAGGGFESYTVRKDIRDEYHAIGMNVPETQIECSYSQMISKELDLKLINDSKSGSGVDRLVRKTLQFILDNSDKINETIFIFEIQMGLRLDWYVKDWNKYGVLNASYVPSQKNGNIYPFTLVQEWHHDDVNKQNEWNQKYDRDINGYLNNFFSHDIHFQRESDKILMFISFLNQLNLDYLVSFPKFLPDSHQKIISNIIPTEKNLNNLFLDMDIWEFCRKFQLLIRQEISHSDNHIGYQGNKKISRIISNYIKNNYRYKIPIYKIYTDNLVTLNQIFQNTDIIIKPESKLEKTSCVLLNLLDSNDFHNDYDIILNYKNKINNVDLSQNKFLILYFHEKMNQIIFEKKIENLTTILGINKNQIILLDSSIEKKNNIEIPLELKLKQYNMFFFNTFTEKTNNILTDTRSKKFTFLIAKPNAERVYVFDKLVYYYNNNETLRTENNIGINFSYSTKSYHDKINFYIKGNELMSLQLPWILDKNLNVHSVDKINIPIHEHYQNSIFSIITETSSEYEPENFSQDFLVDETIHFSNLQISEKSLLPILNGNLPFIVHDGLIYKKLEEIGFDFSYLKELFDIDYKNNSYKQNGDSVQLFVNFIKDKSIDELNEIRKNNIKYIENNFKVLINIFNGNTSLNENKFLNWLFNEKNTI